MTFDNTQSLVQAVVNLVRISAQSEVSEICRLLDIKHDHSRIAVSTEEERRKAELDQYADIMLAPRDDSAGVETAEQLHLSKFVPLRLEYDERRFLRLLESTIDSSEYTDRVDSGPPPTSEHQRHRYIGTVLRNICSVLSGLVIAHDSSEASVKSVLEDRNFAQHKDLFQKMFEIGRRYKILNPERMRDSYVKMMYLLQDMMRPEVRELLGFDFNLEVDTVHALLSARGGSQLLKDPWIDTATKEIIPRGKSKYKVQEEIREKETAIKRLATKYGSSSHLRRHRSRFSMSGFFSSRAGDESSEEGEGSSGGLSREQVERCIYSICDFNTFLRFNQAPCERMIELLHKYFRMDDGSSCLAITEGTDGARLSHSHSRQFTFVLQSLTLWAEVMKDMLRLWHAAEADLLDPENPYVKTQTGQGLQRVQKAPRTLKLMTEILRRVQQRLGGWVGSSTIHLGDENVPNALMCIDKYMQVPKILGPIVLCIDKIENADNLLPGVGDLVHRMGGVDSVQKSILKDFFKHGFDGAGASDFFSSGSCIDGRLTSAWNWCSKIEGKDYFPVFQLTGFVGFDTSK